MPDLTIVPPTARRCTSLPQVGPQQRCDRIAGHEGEHIAWTLKQGTAARRRVWFRS